MAGGRSYSDRTLKLLWGRAAGRCAVASCRIELTIDATDYDPIVFIGDVAHMVAASSGGPRADEGTREARNDYENLILLHPLADCGLGRVEVGPGDVLLALTPLEVDEGDRLRGG